MKPCIDCKFFTPEMKFTAEAQQIDFAKCAHPTVRTVDLVTGKTQ